MALLSIDQVSVAYDKVEAVRGVSLAIEPGHNAVDSRNSCASAIGFRPLFSDSGGAGSACDAAATSSSDDVSAP